ncbi:MAG: Bax inhibitor-1/YccA family protein [Lachnospiraceae bacterium]|nr:Bax inhibitor-1/YccA family protein [Lachnospiraceae bacterium]
MDNQNQNQNQNPYSNNNYYGNNQNVTFTYNQGYLESTNFNSNPYSNNAYNSYDNFNQGFEAGTPQPLTNKQLKYLTIPEVVSKSFLFMFVALLITAFAAFNTSMEFVYKLVMTDTFYLFFIAEIAIVLISNYAIRKNNAILAAILYIAYSYLTGVTLSIIFLAYSMSSIASVFLITAAVFAIMAVYGMITKTDLSSIGNICFMGLLGIIIASLVNAFILHSSGLDFAISCIGVLIFVGLTAYDVQKIKERAQAATTENTMTLALFGAFELYLDFINLFLKLLSLFGKRD